MQQQGLSVRAGRTKPPIKDLDQGQLSLEHYVRVIVHRKWIALAVFVVVSLATVMYSSGLPNIYTSETVILVDPQKVPDAYVRSTVTGDVRNRLGTLSQQILSTTRLQKIVDTLGLYPEERQRKVPREEILMRMKNDIAVNVLSDFGGGQDLQAFRIGYSGKDPRLVAQVTNEIASLFIEENLKAREQQATGTTEFLQNQLQETRKVLEEQEAKLKNFKLQHIGEMPEHQSADLQIMGQLQSQLQLESEALSRADQQKNYLQSLMATQPNAQVVDLDQGEPNVPKNLPKQEAVSAKPKTLSSKAQLAALLSRYSEEHPEVRRMRRIVEEEEAKAASESSPVPETAVETASSEAPAPAPRRTAPSSPPTRFVNPVLNSQLQSLEEEINKHKSERQRLAQMVARYQAKLEAIPVREQEITELVRDYEISKGHYKGLLEKQLSAETATQLEIRQKGERFSVLDPAQPAQTPSRPNRKLYNAAGCIVGLGLGLLMVLLPEFVSMTITSPEQVMATTGIEVLEVIPIIATHLDQAVQKRRIVTGIASAGVLAMGCGAWLVFHYRDRIF